MPFVVALGAAFVLMPLARAVGAATGMVDRPSDPSLAIHAKPVPLLGGPAVIVGAFGAVALVADWVGWGLLAGTGIALATGLADDVRPLPPLVRLVLLAGAGVALAAGGVRVEPLGALAGVATVALAIACANATNLLDGQNGLAGGLGVASALGLAAVAPGGSEARSVGLALAGALVAFLAWNMPGRIFLGNGGAYAIGVLLAALAAEVAAVDGWRGVLAATACLGVLAFEILFTVARRIGSGASLTTGDRLHSYDIVAVRTGSRVRSTVGFWIGAGLAAAVGIAIDRVPLGAGAAVAAACALAAAGWGAHIWRGRGSTT